MTEETTREEWVRVGAENIALLAEVERLTRVLTEITLTIKGEGKAAQIAKAALELSPRRSIVVRNAAQFKDAIANAKPNDTIYIVGDIT